MGNARWSNVDWDRHAQATAPQSRSQIFTQGGMHADLDPAKIKFREAVDSPANPASTPIILAADETGSMGILAETIIKTDLGIVMKELYDRKPVTDPQICCMATGDAYTDVAPLQVTQFEASIVLAEQLKNFYLEGNGGGNGGESYALAWAFAAYKTKCDAIRKRKRKGYLFTIGDEAPHLAITRDQLRTFFGMPAEADMNAKALLDHAQQDWNIFHLIVKPVDNQPVVAKWRELLGERAIVVPNHENLAAGIVSVIQVIEGMDPLHVSKTWTGSDAVTAHEAVMQLTAGAV